MKKRALALALVMCFALLPSAAFAADSDFVINENGILLEYRGSGGHVVIPEGVTTIGSWEVATKGFSDRADITSVTFPNSLTYIGNGAFQKCTGLTEVTIPANVFAIINGAFQDCTNLKRVTILNGDCSLSGMIDGLPMNEGMTVYSVPGGEVETFVKNRSHFGVHFEAIDAASLPSLDLTSASTWAHEGITNAVAASLVPQDLQSSYTQATTRAEFAALAVALYEQVTGAEITERKTFADTSDVNVEKAAAIGVVTGVGDNKFNPQAGLTREQAAVMLTRLANILGKPLAEQAATFADNNSIAAWAIAEVGQIQAAGIMSGVGNNTFDPQGAYTREQSIVTTLRLYDVVTETAAR